MGGRGSTSRIGVGAGSGSAFRRLGVKLSANGADSEMQSELANALGNVMRDFPKMKGAIQSISFAGSEGANYSATTTSDYLNGTSSIVFDKRFKTKAGARKSLEQNKSLYAPNAEKHTDYAFYHELGHAVATRYGMEIARQQVNKDVTKNAVKLFKHNQRTIADVNYRLHTVGSRTLLARASRKNRTNPEMIRIYGKSNNWTSEQTNNLMRDIKAKKMPSLGYRSQMSTISKYAERGGYREAVTEAFADHYINGKNANPFSTAIFNELKKSLG